MFWLYALLVLGLLLLLAASSGAPLSLRSPWPELYRLRRARLVSSLIPEPNCEQQAIRIVSDQGGGAVRNG